jgi:hypothetical protein
MARLLMISAYKEKNMATFSVGARVRIKNRPDWPSPPGYIFANAEGTVVASDFDEVMGEFQPYLVFVKLEKVGEAAKTYNGNSFWFLTEFMERI